MYNYLLGTVESKADYFLIKINVCAPTTKEFLLYFSNADIRLPTS
jgi:hypothetical protein